MKQLCLIIISLISHICFAQSDVDFTLNKQFYLKGNTVLIGNNIVSVDKTKALTDLSKFNDTEKLVYVDIDDDESTFSSSQATLTIPENSKIKYAAIYWSAIYPYNHGETKTKRTKNLKETIYIGDNQRASDLNSILFKTPNSHYIPIEGTVIMDEKTSKKLENTHPYVCFADVTSLLQNTENTNGDYTLANMRATQGFAPGGSAGGWLLYIIYENDLESAKYFTVYNGFADVYEEPVNILFQNFKTPEKGDIKTSLLLGALEGDKKFKSDNCGFLDVNNNYIPIFNKVRPKSNFFNSSITLNENTFLDRLPASTNTLGFDLLKIEIPNANNSIIANDSKHATAQFNSRIDRYYLFFVAFETEINPVYLENSERIEDVPSPKNELTAEIKNDTISEEKEASIPTINSETLTTMNKDDAVIIDPEFEKIKNLESISVPNINKGYYLITNVFSKKYHTSKWIEFLKEKKYTPQVFTNPKNGWHSVYINNDLDPNIVYKKLKELESENYFKDLWILKINF